ncbi:hypothetical protein M011DRAFT_346284 [Sporormia fimetaria CBS 119925]|uniref:Uncharacterized protein n=1 Tax=Sporormia fimetaria CBS 119925 TaxID=1340428 RepID=A0A6A6VCU2_9PLEO|nr:hypothetical protein M011DRAFT_346284 [Sporormia fimetaria CBS 119925]
MLRSAISRLPFAGDVGRRASNEVSQKHPPASPSKHILRVIKDIVSPALPEHSRPPSFTAANIDRTGHKLRPYGMPSRGRSVDSQHVHALDAYPQNYSYCTFGYRTLSNAPAPQKARHHYAAAATIYRAPVSGHWLASCRDAVVPSPSAAKPASPTLTLHSRWESPSWDN